MKNLISVKMFISGLVGVIVIIVGRGRVRMRSVFVGGIVYYWGIGSGLVVVGRWIRMVK